MSSRGRKIVERQGQVIKALASHGRSTERPESLLDQFERTQAIFEQHLEELLTKS
jgi:hypothetical protein